MYQDIDASQNNEHCTVMSVSGVGRDYDNAQASARKQITVHQDIATALANVGSDLGNARLCVQWTGLIELQGNRYF